MKQFQLEQVKFPKLTNNAIQQPILPQNTRPKSKAQSQMLRIIIALLIAIFIFNSSQETTINYNEIIKNQKMFLVKNIRGVLPTLSGNLRDLYRSWKVVHFQNYHSNQSEIFNNYTLKFNQSFLFVQNLHCKFNITYEWQNYSYNIDFEEVTATQNQPKQTTQQIIPQQGKQSQDQTKITANTNKKNTSQIFINQTQFNSGLSSSTVPVSSKGTSDSSKDKIEVSAEQKQKQKTCVDSKKYFLEVFKFASIWTISDTNLYILLQNTHLEEDFYMILQPLEI